MLTNAAPEIVVVTEKLEGFIGELDPERTSSEKKQFFPKAYIQILNKMPRGGSASGWVIHVFPLC
jgi:hypothetical protein